MRYHHKGKTRLQGWVLSFWNWAETTSQSRKMRRKNKKVSDLLDESLKAPCSVEGCKEPTTGMTPFGTMCRKHWDQSYIVAEDSGIGQEVRDIEEAQSFKLTPEQVTEMATRVRVEYNIDIDVEDIIRWMSRDWLEGENHGKKNNSEGAVQEG